MEIIERIKQQKLVAVIRGASIDDIPFIAEALYKGNVDILEITAETPGVLKLIEQIRSLFGDKVIVGAGTVLDPETARAAIMSGAEFIFSPTVNVETIQMAKRYNVVSIPGAMTPTEILTAYEAGADIVKVFPATALGPGYLKDIHGPLPQIPLMPTGGVNLDNITNYLQNGATAVGLGGSLIKSGEKIDEQSLESIAEKAAQFREKVSSFTKNQT